MITHKQDNTQGLLIGAFIYWLATKEKKFMHKIVVLM